jgi:branched-chain amino acid transport system substrate-binding protein
MNPRHMVQKSALSIIMVAIFLLSACVPSEQPTPAALQSTTASNSPSVVSTTPVNKPTEAPASATKVDKVVIGLVYPTTGAVSVIGQAMVNGHMLAADKINSNGGIKSLGGAKIVFEVGDTQGKPEIGLSQVRRLVEQVHAPAIMGAYQSGVSLPTTQLAEELQTPYLVPIGSSDEISSRGFKYTFKISPKGSKASLSELEFLKEMNNTTNAKVNTVGLVYIDNLYGKQQADILRKQLADYPFKIVADLAYPENTTDVSGVIAKLKAANPDVVLQSSYVQDGILLSRALSDQKWSPSKGWMGFGGNAADPQFFTSVGNQANNYFTLGFWTPTLTLPSSSGFEEAVSQYQSKFGAAMDEYSAVAYTATFVMADALERAASTKPEDIRAAMSATNIKVGQFGNLFRFDITFPPDGQVPSNFIVAQHIDGKSVVVWPSSSAGENKPVWPAILGTIK